MVRDQWIKLGLIRILTNRLYCLWCTREVRTPWLSAALKKGELFLQGPGAGCVNVTSKMFKNYVADQQLNLKDIIKTMEKISLDLRKMDELVNLLLCDLILNFSHPVKTEVVAKVEENNVVSEDFKISDQLELIPTLSNGI